MTRWPETMTMVVSRRIGRSHSWLYGVPGGLLQTSAGTRYPGSGGLKRRLARGRHRHCTRNLFQYHQRRVAPRRPLAATASRNYPLERPSGITAKLIVKDNRRW